MYIKEPNRREIKEFRELKKLKESKNKQYYNNSDKNTQTKRINKSFNTSKPEEIFYSYLLTKYDKDDIIRQYKDDRYPFNCDFYIKSKDLFIELNLHPCHNFKPFDSRDKKDLDELAYLNEKAKLSDYYKNIVKVWSISDPIKQNIASKNKLNYICIYTENELNNIITNKLI